jgi:metal-responsive CopG/Arc/MetJ family transcriptional regulator
MAESRAPAEKITISLPAELLAYADAQARRRRTSRSQVITQALEQLKREDEARLAAEGYAFYAAEAVTFAEASGQAVAEALVAAPAEPDDDER